MNSIARASTLALVLLPLLAGEALAARNTQPSGKNRPPTAVADAASTAYQTAVAVAVLANDSDPEGNALTISGNTQPANGSAVKSSSGIQYTPRSGFSGTDSFSYTISDGAKTASTTVTITVAPRPNTAPVAVADSVATPAGQAVTIGVLANDSDPDGDSLTLGTIGSPAHGTASSNGSSVAYTPATGWFGQDSFTYAVSDGRGGSASATVSITVSAPEVAKTSNGSAVLSWTIPTTRADGTALSPGELAGYEIYVLTESTGQSQVIALDEPLASTYTVSGLATDVYYFSIAARDSSGQLSAMSDVVSKSIAP